MQRCLEHVNRLSILIPVDGSEIGGGFSGSRLAVTLATCQPQIYDFWFLSSNEIPKIFPIFHATTVFKNLHVLTHISKQNIPYFRTIWSKHRMYAIRTYVDLKLSLFSILMVMRAQKLTTWKVKCSLTVSDPTKRSSC